MIIDDNRNTKQPSTVTKQLHLTPIGLTVCSTYSWQTDRLMMSMPQTQQSLMQKNSHKHTPLQHLPRDKLIYHRQTMQHQHCAVSSW